MLTFVSPRDRLLLRFLKPKVAAWRWFQQARSFAGMRIERHEYLEDVLNRQIQNYDLFNFTGGFTYEGDHYLLKLQMPAGGFADRPCASLLEVATVVSFKFKTWFGTEVCSVPGFSTAALNASGPGDFIQKYLEILRNTKLDQLRRLWLLYLTTEREVYDSKLSQIRCIAGILMGNYESAHAEADIGQKFSDGLVHLGIDKRQAYNDIFDLMPPLILKDLQLHRPHAYHLYTMCDTEEELRKLLSGDAGFLRAKRALMTAEQRDYMFGGELGL